MKSPFKCLLSNREIVLKYLSVGLVKVSLEAKKNNIAMMNDLYFFEIAVKNQNNKGINMKAVFLG